MPDDEWVGALWDVHHPYRMGEPVADTDALIGSRVRHVHVKDAVRAGDGWSFLRLGEGELPVQPMLRALAARGYDGYVSVDWEKMWHPEIEDPETVLPQYAETLRRYLALSGSRWLTNVGRPWNDQCSEVAIDAPGTVVWSRSPDSGASRSPADGPWVVPTNSPGSQDDIAVKQADDALDGRGVLDPRNSEERAIRVVAGESR